jgi:hypothetical protein
MLDTLDTKAVARVVAATNPLSVRTVDYTVTPDQTIEHIFEYVQPDPVLRRAAHIYINDWYVPRSKWAVVRPKAGTLITIRAYVPPRGGDGGGKDIARNVLLIAVAAAALAFGGPLAGAVGLTGAFGAAAGQAVIGLGGMLLVNALIPPRNSAPTSNGASQTSDGTTTFIENARNVSDPFGVVGDLFGRMRIVPKLAAAPYTDIVGDDQYLNLLLHCGVGPIEFDEASAKIAESLLSSFSDYEIEFREGYDTDDPISIFPDTVQQDNFQIRLNEADGYTTRTSGPNADRISVDVLFAEGLVTIAPDGTRSNRTVVAEFEYSVSGANDWQPIPDNGTKTFPSSWTDTDGLTFSQVSFTQRRTNAIRHGFTFAPSEGRGQYDIRIRRLTTDTSDENIRDALVWSALRAITNESPVRSPVPVALIALRIKATDQLNGVIDDFSIIGQRVCLDWDIDTTSWIMRATSNPASLYRYAYQSYSLQVPYPDAALDLTMLSYWAEFCNDHGFEFNQFRDFRSSFPDLLGDIASAGRAAQTNIDGKWSVVIDEPKSPVSHVTPRNSRGFTANKAFLDKPHAIRITFQNEEQDYRTDELRVYLDGYNEETATKFETANYPGVTSPALITKHARFAAAVAVHRPEQFTFVQDMERFVYKRGDVIKLTHDVIMIGIGPGGRFKSVELDIDGNAISAVVDTPLPMEASVNYGVSIRTVANVAVTAQIVTNEGVQTNIEFASPIPAIDAPSAGDLFGFGVLGSETDDALIIDIDPVGDLYDATITAVPYREVVYNIDASPIPAFDSKLTPIASVPDVVVESVRSDESVLTVGSGESLSVHIAVKVQPLTDQDGTLDIQIRPSTTGEPYSAAQVDSFIGNEAMIGDVRTGEYFDVRLRWIVPGRLPGDWSYISNHRVVGKSTNPDPLVNLTISTFGGQAFLRWDAPRELDVIFGGEVRFRHSADPTPSWSNSTSIGQAAQAKSLFATLPLRPGTYMCKVFDDAGNQSDVVMVDAAQASVLTYAPVDSIDEAPSFGGVKTNTTVDGIALKIGGAGQWDDIPDIDAEADIDAFGGTSEITVGEYEFEFGFDFGVVSKMRITLRILAGVFGVNDLIDSWSEDIDTRADFDGENTAEADCIVYVALTDDDPSGSPTWGAWQRFDSMEVHARGCKFKAVLTSYNHDFNIAVTELGVDAEEVV